MKKSFEYKGTEITFLHGEDVMVNATDMAKAFGKNPKDYLRTDSAKELVQALSSRHNSLVTDLVTVTNGGPNRGTWMHEDIAIDFAQWLSVDFRIWCNDKIKELLQKGVVSIVNMGRKQLAQMVIESEEELEAEKARSSHLLEIKQLQERELKEQAPKVEYFNKVLDTSNVLRATVVASDFGMSAMKLNKKLKSLGVLRKVAGDWVLTSKYLGNGYAEIKPHPYTSRSGEQKTAQSLVWTEKGREFLHGLLGLNAQTA